MKTQRIASLDFIRLVAIVLVITQHAWSGLQLDEPSVGAGRYFYQALVVLGVPLFFMLSGSLMLGAKVLPLRDFLTRRFKRLLIPFLLWGTVIYVVSAAMHKYPDVQTLQDAVCNYLSYMLSGKTNAAYWYIFVLIGLYLLTPFLQYALLGPQTKQLVRYGLVLWLGWLVLRAYYPQFGSMHYYNSSAFMYMGFYLCGYYCVRYLTNERLNRYIGTVGFVSAYILYVWGISVGIDTSLFHVMATVCLFLLLKSCTVPDRVVGLVTSAGQYTYVVYFVHVPLVSLLCTLDVWHWCILWLRPAVIALVASVASYLVAWLFHRIRFVPNAWIGI